MSKKYPRVYMDISIGTKAAGRIIFELFTDLTPKTAENFRGLCTGEYGNVGMGTKTKKLHYLNSTFHRVVEGFAIQGGDITNGDGTGGASIYGPTFADENFSRKHACAGLLSMANRGRNTNSSQFFITLRACPHLDGKHVVFGQVIDGMDTVRKIAKAPVDMHDRPKIPIVIVDCGELNDFRNFLRYDPFHQLAKKELQKGTEEEAEEKQEEEETEKDGEKAKEQVGEQAEEPESDIPIPVNLKLPEDKLEKLKRLKEKINESKKLNNQAVLEEEKKMNDPNYEKYQKKEKWLQKQKEISEENEFKGIDNDRAYLNTTALKAEYLAEHKKKSHETFGWDVFNEDSLFRAYKKRIKALPVYKDAYEQQKNDPNAEVPITEERLQNLVDDLQAQEEKRRKFSRRRTFYDDEDVTYINERNRVYNKKLERAFGQYAADIKLSLERGTAL